MSRLTRYTHLIKEQIDMQKNWSTLLSAIIVVYVKIKKII